VRALVVADFAFNRDLHKLLLQQEGVEVTLARDGKETFEKYKAQGSEFFDFILMDIQMPVMDGFTSAKEIRLWKKRIEREMWIFILYQESIATKIMFWLRLKLKRREQKQLV